MRFRDVATCSHSRGAAQHHFFLCNGAVPEEPGPQVKVSTAGKGGRGGFESRRGEGQRSTTSSFVMEQFLRSQVPRSR